MYIHVFTPYVHVQCTSTVHKYCTYILVHQLDFAVESRYTNKWQNSPTINEEVQILMKESIGINKSEIQAINVLYLYMYVPV